MRTEKSAEVLKINRKKRFCRTLGPGARSVVWFFGCSRSCPGCIAKIGGEVEDYTEETPSELADWVLECSDAIEGITLSGGEPFEQPLHEMAQFLEKIRADSKLSVIVYTGSSYEELLQNGAASRLLGLIDVLIDGPYRQGEDYGQLWRGSENQRFHFLSPRYKEHKDDWFAARGREVEIDLDINKSFLLSGLPRKNFISELTQQLKKKGIQLSFGNRGEE